MLHFEPAFINRHFMSLEHQTIALLLDDLYNDVEVWYPYYRLKEAGVNVFIAGKEKMTYSSKYGYPAAADISLKNIKPSDIDGVIIPGGFCPDKLRTYPEVLKLVRAVDNKGGLVASICHGAWVVISAGLAKNRSMTCYSGIKDDVKNAGALYEDKPVVVFDNLVTSRKPADLPDFMTAILRFLSKKS